MHTQCRPLRLVKQLFQRKHRSSIEPLLDMSRKIHSLGSVGETACSKGNLNNEMYPAAAVIACQRHSHSGSQPCNGYADYIETMSNGSCMDPREPSENVSRTPIDSTFAIPKYIQSKSTRSVAAYSKKYRSCNQPVPTSPLPVDENLTLYENQLNLPVATILQNQYSLHSSLEISSPSAAEITSPKEEKYDFHNFPGKDLVCDSEAFFDTLSPTNHVSPLQKETAYRTRLGSIKQARRTSGVKSSVSIHPPNKQGSFTTKRWSEPSLERETRDLLALSLPDKSSSLRTIPKYSSEVTKDLAAASKAAASTDGPHFVHSISRSGPDHATKRSCQQTLTGGKASSQTSSRVVAKSGASFFFPASALAKRRRALLATTYRHQQQHRGASTGIDEAMVTNESPSDDSHSPAKSNDKKNADQEASTIWEFMC